MNNFSTELKKLVQTTGIKYASLSDAVQYDISYISKWINGKTLPSDKNIQSIADSISDALTKEIDDEKKDRLIKMLGINKTDDLKKAVYDDLIKAFYGSRESLNLKTEYFVTKPVDEIAKNISSYGINESIVSLIDILNIKHEARLTLAGIIGGHFSVGVDKSSSFDLMIDVDTDDSTDILYNTIFIIHMLTSLSGINFRLYHNKEAKGKLLYAIDGKYALSAMIVSNDNDLKAVTETNDQKYISQLDGTLRHLIDRDRALFENTSLTDMLNNKNYIKSMISTNIKCLLGHITEHLLPKDAFLEICENESFFDKDELKKTYYLSKNVIDNSDIRIVLYDNAISEFSVKGEVDFYNHKVIVAPDVRINVLKNILKLLNENKIRLIKSYLNPDFQYISNPCVFLSDSISYLRLENERYEENIKLLNDNTVHELFGKFFELVWKQRNDVVIDDAKLIKERIEHYIAQIGLLNELKL